MITRRAFLGILGVTAAIPTALISSGQQGYAYIDRPQMPPELLPVELEADPLADGMALPYATRLLHRRVLSHLGPLYALTTATRGEQYWVGSSAGGGSAFDTLVTAYIPEVDVRAGKLEIDRRFVDGIAKDMAEKMRAERIRFTGRMELPQGMVEAVNIVNKRLALRGVYVYNVLSNRMEIRFDILGARG